MAIESAPGIAASQIERYIADEVSKYRAEGKPGMEDICIMRERSGYIEGVPKNELITYEYFFELERKLGDGTLGYYDKLMSYDKKPEKEKARLEAQMRNFRMQELKKLVEHGDQHYKLTAKLSGGASDDTLIALCMVLYWKGVFKKDAAKYGDWHSKILQICNIVFPL